MAIAFGEFVATTMAMINFIEKMKAVMTHDDASDEMKEMIESISAHQEAAFKAALQPYIERIRMVEKQIRNAAPKAPGQIVTPDDPDFEVPN